MRTKMSEQRTLLPGPWHHSEASGEGKTEGNHRLCEGRKHSNDTGKHTTRSTPQRGAFCSSGSAWHRARPGLSGRETSLNLGSATSYLHNSGQSAHLLEPQFPEGNTFYPPEETTAEQNGRSCHYYFTVVSFYIN